VPIRWAPVHRVMSRRYVLPSRSRNSTLFSINSSIGALTANRRNSSSSASSPSACSALAPRLLRLHLFKEVDREILHFGRQQERVVVLWVESCRESGVCFLQRLLRLLQGLPEQAVVSERSVVGQFQRESQSFWTIRLAVSLIACPRGIALRGSLPTGENVGSVRARLQAW